jgi:thymidylate kinase
LYVFEGADGVGKSELSRWLASRMESTGASVMRLGFPGNENESLGKLVYSIHHDPAKFGLGPVSESSKQLLHIAAHLDAIERTIVPALREGTTVILDRFWWSTRVYGLASGIRRRLIDGMIDVELVAWGAIKPTRVFLVTRDIPLRAEPPMLWQRWNALYNQLAADQERVCPVTVIKNHGTVEEAGAQICAALELSNADVKTTRQLGLEFGASERQRKAPYVFSALAPAQPTQVYETYWRFAAERQAIFFRRQSGNPPPWTGDPVLREYKFTNAYRASDRVSQYLISNIIYQGSSEPEELFFRIILFKLFNKIETWELLSRSFGGISYRDFNLNLYDQVLTKAMVRGDRIYSAAYIMPSGSTSASAETSRRKHRCHLELLERMMADELPLRVRECKSMCDGFTLLRSYPMLGDFLSYQYITDLNYSDLTSFSEMEFVVPGPGARSGISKCFDSLGGISEADIIRVITDRQSDEFRRLDIDFQSLWGRPLQLVDCQNLFCEVDKYARIVHPEYPGSANRTRIKQKFHANAAGLTYWYPPKWHINERMSTGVSEADR